MALLLLFLLSSFAWAGTSHTPLLPHKDPADAKEFSNLYQSIGRVPSIFVGGAAPTFAPSKIGDIFVSTSTAKVYISVSTATVASWAILN